MVRASARSAHVDQPCSVAAERYGHGAGGQGTGSKFGAKRKSLRRSTKTGGLKACPSCRKCCSYCGQRFQVFKRAGKTCSEMAGPAGVVYVSRRLRDTVHLEHRCDGRAYGGCQAGCLIFWKEAWLKRVGATDSRATAGARAVGRSSLYSQVRPLHRGSDSCGSHVSGAGRRSQVFVPSHPVAEVDNAAEVVGRPAICRSLSLRQQFPRDSAEGHCIPALLLRYAGAFAALGCCVALGLRSVPVRLGRPSVSRGSLARLQLARPHPRLDMDLKPGELVRVKSYEQIL